METCDVCSAKVHELRRGRCWGCYQHWVGQRPVGVGARCVTCSEMRRAVLKTVELFGSWKPMCFNCSGQLLHLEPLPTTLSEMRELVSRERRRKDRRVGKPDSRVFQYERRVGERRDLRAASSPQKGKPVDDHLFDELIYDDMIIEVIEHDASSDDGLDFEDVTQIRDMIVDLRPEGFVSNRVARAY